MENALNLPPPKSRKPRFPKISWQLLLKQLSKSVLSIVLAVCLVFGYSYKQPVKAEATATAVVVGGAVLVGVALTALGIGCSNAYPNEQWNKFCQNIWDGACKGVQDGAIAISTAAYDVQYKLSDQFMKSAYQGFTAQFPPGTPLGAMATNDDFVKKMGWSSTFNPASYAGAEPWGRNLAVYALQNVCLIKTYTKSDLPFERNGLKLAIEDNNYNSVFTASVSDDTSKYFKNVARFVPYDDGGFINNSVQWGEFSAYDPATKCDVWLFLSNTGSAGYEGFKEAATTPADPTTVKTDEPYVPGDKAIYAQGHSILNNSYDDVMRKIKEAQGTLDGINVRIGDAVGNLSQISDQIRAQTQSRVVGQDIADAATDAAADAATNTGRDVSIPKIPSMPDVTLPTGIQRKFPFCLPWDLAACYRLFQVSPKAPVWNVPVNIDVGMIHVHQTYTYDLNSNGVLDKGITVFKWFEDLLFVLGLILITKKIMS